MLRLPAEEARHARVALRLREGDALEVCDGRGAVVQAVIAGSDKNGMTARAVAPPVLVPLPLWQWQVAVACGSLKGGRADWLVEKCAELGASALVPLLTERSRIVGGAGGRQGREKLVQKRREDGDEADQSMSASEGGREARWLRVSTAAMKQCLRAHSMHITAPCTVDALCADLQGASAVFVGVAGAPPLHQAAAEVAQRLQPAGEVDSTSRRGVLLIGPEGDFTQQELANLAAAGATPVGLGDLRLRAETAAVTMLAYVRLAFP